MTSCLLLRQIKNKNKKLSWRWNWNFKITGWPRLWSNLDTAIENVWQCRQPSDGTENLCYYLGKKQSRKHLLDGHWRTNKWPPFLPRAVFVSVVQLNKNLYLLCWPSPLKFTTPYKPFKFRFLHYFLMSSWLEIIKLTLRVSSTGSFSTDP